MKEKYDKFGIWYDGKGYPCIWINRKEIKLHVYIWEKHNGNKPKHLELHHKDFNKKNYSLENLELLTKSDHRRLHAGWIRENGKWTMKPCNKCNRNLLLEQFYFVTTRNIESALCKKCHNEVIKERNQRPENIIKRKKYNSEYYRKHYGKQR